MKKYMTAILFVLEFCMLIPSLFAHLDLTFPENHINQHQSIQASCDGLNIVGTDSSEKENLIYLPINYTSQSN